MCLNVNANLLPHLQKHVTCCIGFCCGCEFNRLDLLKRLSGKLVGTNYFYYFCIMELFKQLASLMLPSQILDYFDVVKVEEGATLIEISLDETYPESYKADENIESKGFMEPTTITDFPIRDHKLLLHVRRRRWLNRKDGVSFCRPLNLVAEGTCYSKEFAAFLKDTYGEFPSDLPYA